MIVETLHKSSIERYKVRISEHQKTIKEAGTWFISWRVFSMCCITKKKRRAPERERVFYFLSGLNRNLDKVKGKLLKKYDSQTLRRRRPHFLMFDEKNIDGDLLNPKHHCSFCNENCIVTCFVILTSNKQVEWVH